jgi:hypothetical protein
MYQSVASSDMAMTKSSRIGGIRAQSLIRCQIGERSQSFKLGSEDRGLDDTVDELMV